MPAPRPNSLIVAGLALMLFAADPGWLGARQAEGDDWPQWRGPRRDGVSTETGLLTNWPEGGPREAWTGAGLGIGFSSVAVTGGRVFTMGDRASGQHVIALDDADGHEVWATRVGDRLQADYSGPRSTPTVAGDRLFVVTTSGDLVCLETATGRVVWRKSLPRDFGGRMMSSWSYSESPLVDGDRVVVTPGGPRAGIVALEAATGREIWRATVPRFGREGNDGAGYASIVVSNGGGVKQYVQLMGRGLVGVRASDGWFMWGYDRVANGTANITTPIVSGDLVFGSSSYGAGSALLSLAPAPENRVTAREEYFLNRVENHHGGMVLVDGFLYGGHGLRNGFPVCIEVATGRSSWGQVRGAGTGSAAVAAADGHLYFRYEDGTMALIEANPRQYVLKSRFDIPGVRQPSWPHPVIANGRLYLREQDALHVYDIRR
jgi:outer membrane protein assembly factor BamB